MGSSSWGRGISDCSRGWNGLGTIREACLATGLSYRTCLNRIRQMERTLGSPMVATRRGGAARGGAALTPIAQQLVRVYRDWREEVERASQRAFARATRRLAPALAVTRRTRATGDSGIGGVGAIPDFKASGYLLADPPVRTTDRVRGAIRTSR